MRHRRQSGLFAPRRHRRRFLFRRRRPDRRRRGGRERVQNGRRNGLLLLTAAAVVGGDGRRLRGRQIGKRLAESRGRTHVVDDDRRRPGKRAVSLYGYRARERGEFYCLNEKPVSFTRKKSNGRNFLRLRPMTRATVCTCVCVFEPLSRERERETPRAFACVVARTGEPAEEADRRSTCVAARIERPTVVRMTVAKDVSPPPPPQGSARSLYSAGDTLAPTALPRWRARPGFPRRWQRTPENAAHGHAFSFAGVRGKT